MLESATRATRVACLILALALSTSAQTSSVDPKALITQAADSNRLTSSGINPWHLRATYKLLDEAGNQTEAGTYEEFWVSPTRFKRSFGNAVLTATEYGGPDGVSRSGSLAPISSLLFLARTEIVEPLPPPEALEHSEFNLIEHQSGTLKLSCIALRSASVVAPNLHCLAGTPPIVRLTVLGSESLQVVHNRILNFRGQFVPGDLEISRDGKRLLTAHLDTIESLTPDDALFTPTSDAKPLPRRINVSAGVAQGMISKSFPPIYPAKAKSMGLSGMVSLEADIGTDGRVQSLKVINGPAILQQPALDAVKQWTYRPFLLNGIPVEVHTVVNVIFSLAP